MMQPQTRIRVGVRQADGLDGDMLFVLCSMGSAIIGRPGTAQFKAGIIPTSINRER
ncbi:hypothetical protein AZSP09_13350 [Azospira sp. I09]|nr:hypothetical protein AZSP09_13350 [Azospira sp. I09]